MPVIYKALSSNSSTEKEKHGREEGRGREGEEKEGKKIVLFPRNNLQFRRK